MIIHSSYACLTGCVILKKVKFATRQEHEYISNYKIAQNTFKKVGVDKVIRSDFFPLHVHVLRYDGHAW